VIDWHHPQYDFTKSKQLPYPSGGRKVAVGPEKPGDLSGIPPRPGEGARFQLRQGGRALVGLQRAGLPGRRRVAGHQAHETKSAPSSRHHHEQPSLSDSGSRLQRHGHEQHHCEDGSEIRRLRHARATHPRHRHAGRRLGNLHDPQHHLGLQRTRPRVEDGQTNHPQPHRHRQQGRQLPAQHRTQGRWQHPRREHRLAPRHRRVDETQRRSHLRHPSQPVCPRSRGAVARSKKIGAGATRLYLHVFDWPKDGKLVLPPLTNRPLRAHLLGHTQNLSVTSVAGGITVALPSVAPDPIATVVVLDVAGPVAPAPAHAVP
jgi:hypothetical protein